MTTNVSWRLQACALFITAFTLASCKFDPNIPRGSLACSDTSACPAGYSCEQLSGTEQPIRICCTKPGCAELPPERIDQLRDSSFAAPGDASSADAMPVETPDASDGDAFVVPKCTANAECEDQLWCNGLEVCDPSQPAADVRGCVAGTQVACAAGQTCDEQTDSCTLCSVNPDGDGDGVNAINCGGTDCDDRDPKRFPGKPEVCDGIDNDCDDSKDGPIATASCPAVQGGSTSCTTGRCQPACPADFALDATQTACARIDDCAGVTTCAPGSCVDGTAAYTCNCPVGFEGTGSKSCQCPRGTRLSGSMCREPQWSAPVTIADNVFIDKNYVLTVADDGSAALLWTSTGRVVGRSFLKTGGWQAGTSQTASSTPSLTALSAAALPQGGAVFIGHETRSAPRLYAGVLRLNGFQTSTQPDSGINFDGSYNPSVSGNGAGTVVATWYTYDTTDIRAHAYVDVYRDGTGWTGRVQQREGTGSPSSAINTMGNGILAYAGDSFSTNATGAWGLYSPNVNVRTPIALNRVGGGVGGGSTGSLARFSFATGWSTPEDISGGKPLVRGIDDSGRILAAWHENPQTINFRYFSNNAWSATAAAYTSAWSSSQVKLAVAANGEAVAAWFETGSPAKIRAQRFVPGLNWQGLKALQVGGSFVEPADIAVGMDPEGNAMVVWLEKTGGTNRLIRFARME